MNSNQPPFRGMHLILSPEVITICLVTLKHDGWFSGHGLPSAMILLSTTNVPRKEDKEKEKDRKRGTPGAPLAGW